MALPMPREPPVTNTTLFFNPRSTGSSPLRRDYWDNPRAAQSKKHARSITDTRNFQT
jgi:hypothetical protein